MGFLISTILLLLFAVLAIIDGFYLHIFKYQLHNRLESKFEHFTHTLRAILFPLIVYFLYIKQDCNISFFIGVFLVFVDVLVLTVDAYVEKESRAFMGGLPRWEYILHLFVNGFHFASIGVFLALKLDIKDHDIIIIPNLTRFSNFNLFEFVAENLIPGAILLAAIHIITSIKFTRLFWNNLRSKIKCC